MWFSSVFLKTLRDYRIAILGWGLGLGLLMYTVLSAVSALIATPAARADLVSLAGSFAWIAEPIHVDTAGGYATWKYGFTILIMALWPILVGSRMLRGEEERGSMDVLLSLPRGRARVALEKLAAIQMLDVSFPTTDGRRLVMPRYTEPSPEQALLLHQLNLVLPQQPPPRITCAASSAPFPQLKM